jgi:hypothetical protein
LCRTTVADSIPGGNQRIAVSEVSSDRTSRIVIGERVSNVRSRHYLIGYGMCWFAVREDNSFPTQFLIAAEKPSRLTRNDAGRRHRVRRIPVSAVRAGGLL